MRQVRLEVQELESRPEVRHRQSIDSVDEAIAFGIADLEKRAEKNHLEQVTCLEGILSR